MSKRMRGLHEPASPLPIDGFVLCASSQTSYVRQGSLRVRRSLFYSLPIFEASVDDLCSKKRMLKLRCAGWHCTLKHEGVKVANADIRIMHGAEHPPQIMMGTNAGHLVSELRRQAACCLKGRASAYQPCILCIPGLGVNPDRGIELVWLRPERTIGLFAAMDSSVIGLMPGCAYTLKDIRRAIAGSPAKKRAR